MKHPGCPAMGDSWVLAIIDQRRSRSSGTYTLFLNRISLSSRACVRDDRSGQTLLEHRWAGWDRRNEVKREVGYLLLSIYIHRKALYTVVHEVTTWYVQKQNMAVCNCRKTRKHAEHDCPACRNCVTGVGTSAWHCCWLWTQVVNLQCSDSHSLANTYNISSEMAPMGLLKHHQHNGGNNGGNNGGRKQVRCSVMHGMHYVLPLASDSYQHNGW